MNFFPRRVSERVLPRAQRDEMHLAAGYQVHVTQRARVSLLHKGLHQSKSCLVCLYSRKSGGGVTHFTTGGDNIKKRKACIIFFNYLHPDGPNPHHCPDNGPGPEARQRSQAGKKNYVCDILLKQNTDTDIVFWECRFKCSHCLLLTSNTKMER